MNDHPEQTAAILRQTVIADPNFGRCPMCGRFGGIAMSQSGVCAEILCMYDRRWFPASAWRERRALAGAELAGADLGDGSGVVGSLLWFVGTGIAVAGGIALYAYLAKPKRRRAG